MTFRTRTGSRRRRGITILEVLIAAGVLAIGMFGVMAMIPLIAMRLREGEIADRSSILSRNAVETFQIRGWTDPNRWQYFRYPDGRFVNPNNPPPGPPSVFPFTPAICVDPLGVAGIPGANALRVRFPYRPLADDDRYAMQRVTTVDMGTGPPAADPLATNMAFMGVAEVGAVAEDDLLFERPKARTDLPFQTFPVDRNVSTAAAQQTRRMAQRDYSHLATMTPLDNVTAFTGRGNYLLSAVVFYQRSRAYEASEHVGWIDNSTAGGYGFGSGGISGGDVAISRRDATDTEILNLSKGDWVMLTYPELRTTATPYVIIQAAYHRWYQVIEVAPYDSVLEPNYRFATLAGPDWPYLDDPATAAVEWAEDIQVTWLPGVASVSEKTIHLGSGGTWE